jgi:AcrR family transcriptional regulator
MARALLDAAERILQSDGADALSLRHVADEAETTTRAVYSIFGSRDGLIVALAVRAFGMLGAGVSELPCTNDPSADLVEAAVIVFRRFALEHRGLFLIAFQRQGASPEVARRFVPSARQALGDLHARVGRVLDAAPESHAVAEATLGFHALCEGLAALELRRVFPVGYEERIWRATITALVAGLNGSGAVVPA